GRITITRRVFRTGESEFRLNGKRVRLKDISDILMDTGLGIRNYSVMEQGKIDLILSNKPQDRRRLIEEAAGITKYKTKRRQAEPKLEETQQNLPPLDDTRAARASNVREEIAGLTADVERLRSFLDQSETNLADLAARIGTGREQITTLEAEASEQQALLDEKTQQLEAARAERNHLREVA